MIVAINYADPKYRKTQRFNSATAIYKGKVDKVISYSPKDIDTSFRNKNKMILEKKRGNGYWLWKPYFIEKTLHLLRENDYLVYLDSGAFYMNDVRYLIREMDKDQQDVMTFELPFREKCYTKQDIFIVLGCDNAMYTDTNQRMATMIIVKKTAHAMQFVQEWLYDCQQGTLITDERNHMGKRNNKGFVENRHDQSIFSVLSKKYHFKAYRDPSQYGRFPDIFWKTGIERLESHSQYPQIIAAHKCPEVNKRLYWQHLLYAYAPRTFVWFCNECISRYSRKQDGCSFAVLTDNMPIKEEAYGYGMYKVVNKLIDASGSYIDTIIITDKNFCKDKLDPSLEKKTILRNKFHKIHGDRLADLYFLLEIWKPIRALRRKGIQKIFIPLGADYKELRRAYLVSKCYHLPVNIYVVDDFIEYQRLNRITDEKTKKAIVRYLKEMKQIFVISDGMKERIFDLTGKKSVLLPIPYDGKKMNGAGIPSQLQIMYLGNINDLYIQGIRDAAEVIDKINAERNLDIRLIFTYRNTKEVKREIGNYKCIRSQRIEEESELRKEIRRSLFCIMPYSEDTRFGLLQNTSFPSKLIEYMSSARSIVIYGNEKNTAQAYFEANGLLMVIHGRDKELLEKCILDHIEKRPDYNKEYTTLLRKKHSYKYVKDRLVWNMRGN